MASGAAFQIGLGVVIALVLLALAFDFMNGFHDAANSIATVVSTRVLKPYQAVVLAAAFNFIALFVFHLSVATTVGRGIIDQGIVDHYLVFGALTGAIAWNIITWYYGIPSSSSHALIGGLVGAAVAKAGAWSLIPAGILKTVAFIFISPMVGMVFGALLMLSVSWLFVRVTPSRVDRWFRRLQLVSASLYSLGHGGNDAQKTAGIIWMLLIAAGLLGSGDPIPYWVVAACYVTIALGTAFGGWRIVKTMGQRITKLRPVGGFCAETGGAALGHRRQHPLGLGSHHPLLGLHVRPRLVGGPAALLMPVRRRRSGKPTDMELDCHLPRPLEAQRHGHLVVLLERLFDVDEHEMRPSRLEVHSALGRDVVALHFAHAQDVAVLDVDMRLDLRRGRGGAADQAVGLRRLVAHGHVAGGAFRPGRRRADPGLFDLDLSPRGRGKQGNYESERSHECLRFSSSWSLRQNILPLAVRGSSSTNSMMRGTLKAAIFSRAQSVICAGVTWPRASSFKTMNALTVSPR
jgi:PiT family inorganic phosphate transporter